MNSVALLPKSLSPGLQEQHQTNEKFEAIVDMFLNGEQLEDEILELRQIAESSIRVYKSSFKIFKSYLNKRNVKLIIERDVVGFKKDLEDQGFEVFTRIAHLSAIKSFFSALATRGLYPDVSKNIKVPKRPKDFKRDSLTKEQAQQLLKSAAGNSLLATGNPKM